ncbi:MAG TPA: serine/threonine protein kinase [Candidatus Choladousia intestinavium]|uniref:Serine/threonine protein kinase n=1 Tax=Candidatus Choladousia intestinavium TaxID=2840727 RepID=A0A9D1D906_9FIRM|nr:serine/threonine protein kinase [Candidatus Choladousia intestinavium]
MALKLNEHISNNTKLYTLGGEPVTILNLISEEGGQGDVYKVSWRGKEFALKWYNRYETDVVGENQYSTILKLTQRPNPEPRLFIWPQAIVTETGRAEKGDMFGYVMQLIPAEHYEMKHYLRSDGDPKQKKFDTFHAMIWAGMHIVTAVRALHLTGLSYKDLNPGNIAIHPVTGKAVMVDCDNISVDNDPCTVNGMRGYMAPEIVRSNFSVTPNIQTDQFSLAIILFRLFYMDHPMEGKLWEKFPMITEQVEDELYCRHPLYNMNSQDDRNRPTENYAPNVKKRMALLPKILMEGFEQTFVNGIDHITGRTPENRWLQILSSARDQLVFLDPKCKTDRVVRFDKKETIPRGCLKLTVSKRLNHEVALYPMQSLFKDVVSGDRKDYTVRIGRVSVLQGSLVMQNLSGGVWKVYSPIDRKINPVQNEEWFKVMPETQIQFDEVHNIVGKVDDPRR